MGGGGGGAWGGWGGGAGEEVGLELEDAGWGVGDGEYGWGAGVYGLEARGQWGEMGGGCAGYRGGHDVTVCLSVRCFGGHMELDDVCGVSIVYLDAKRCISMSFCNCSTHFAAKTSSVKRLLEARARFRMADVASSDIESASLKQCAYSDSVLAW